MTDARALQFYPAAIASGVTNISYASGPTYVGPNGVNLLFPFTVANNVIEINPINNFNLNSGIVPQNAGTTVTVSASVKSVFNIGNNFRTYIKNCTWSGRTIPNISSIRVHFPTSVTQVQQLDERFVGEMNTTSFNVTDAAPPSNLAIPLSGFGVTFIFSKPLVIRAVDSNGRTFYITFVTSWDH
jgi:hypothetical protein